MRPKYVLPFWAALLLGLGVPAVGLSAQAPPPQTPPLSASPTQEFFETLSAPPVALEGLPGGDEPTGNLTLRQALSLALLRNPGLASFAWEERALEAAALQAGIRPNPELALEVENFAGSDDLEGFDGAEITIELSQLIELGDKREKRRRAATLGRDLAGYDSLSKRLDVLTSVANSYIQVLVAQERLALATEFIDLAQRFHDAVSERVEAGKVSPVERTRAGVSLASARIEGRKAAGELVAARKRLGAAWDSESPLFERALGSLESIAPPPGLELLAESLEGNPDISRWALEFEERQAGLDLENARSTPDLTVGLGVRRFQESDGNALLLGFSMPLPLFDRNQGGIEEARASLEAAKHERRDAETLVRVSLSESYQMLLSAFAEATVLGEEIIPGAESAFEATNYGYRQGKFGFLEVLDAQRTLFEVRGEYVEALGAYHQARAEVERLLGRSLDAVESTELQKEARNSHEL